MPSAPQTIRQAIQKELARRGWTVYRLAQASGVAESRLGRFLNGQGEMMSRNLDLIFAALELEARRIRRKR